MRSFFFVESTQDFFNHMISHDFFFGIKPTTSQIQRTQQSKIFTPTCKEIPTQIHAKNTPGRGGWQRSQIHAPVLLQIRPWLIKRTQYTDMHANINPACIAYTHAIYLHIHIYVYIYIYICVYTYTFHTCAYVCIYTESHTECATYIIRDIPNVLHV